MSYFKAPRRHNSSLPVVLIIVSFLTASCGFTPVYLQRAEHSVRQNMLLISVAPIGGRDGLLLRNRLTEKFTPLGGANVPRYRLSVQLTSATDALLIQLDNSPTRNNLKMDAAFALMDLATNQNVYQSKANSVGSYNVVESKFATIAAEKNAKERAAREIGEEIFDLIVIFFNRTKS